MKSDLEFSRLVATAKELADKVQISDASDEPVLLRIERQASLTDNGKICFEAAFLILVRMTRALTVEVPGSPELLAYIRELAPRVTRHKVAIKDNEGNYQGFRAILNVGADGNDALPWTTMNSDGWLVRIGTKNGIPYTSEHPNPIGALAAASLGAAEVFKRIYRVKETRGPLHEFLSYSFFDYAPSESLGPPLPEKLDIGGLIQVGAGAIGNGMDFLLARLPISGRWSIIDYQNYGTENLGTCILIGPEDLDKSKATIMATRVPGAKGFPNKIQEFISGIVGVEVQYPRIIVNGLDDIEARRAVQNMWPDLVIDGAIGSLSCEVTLHPWGPDLSCLMCDFELPSENSSLRNSKLIGVAAEKLQDLTRVVTEQDIQEAPENKKPWLQERLGRQYCSILTPAELAEISNMNDGFSPSTPFVACLSSCMVVTELVRHLSRQPSVLETGFQFDVLIGPRNGIKKAHARKSTCICVNRKAIIDSSREKRTHSA